MSKNPPPMQQQYFSTWWKKPQIDSGLASGRVILGHFHVTRKDLGFVRQGDGRKRDVLITGMDYRNRAMDGDFVAVELLPSTSVGGGKQREARLESTLVLAKTDLLAESQDSLWCPTEEFVPDITKLRLAATSPEQEGEDAEGQQTGRVVAVLDAKTLQPAPGPSLGQEVVGTLQLPTADANWRAGERLPARAAYAFFQPDDAKLPSMVILRQNLPTEFVENPHSQRYTMYRAQLESWPDNKKLPFGLILGRMGTRGEIHSETMAILQRNNVCQLPFSDAALACVPQTSETGAGFEIPSEELAKRRDLRNELIFTIDPSTAKDIDDALHCREISPDLYEVGVHIADVSHFVTPNSEVDKEAIARCTSVYLVQKCLPMLPPILSEEVCSLNPHCDRLAFSVIWRMNSRGELVTTTSDGARDPVWFGKSVIRSDCKLDYGLAHSIATTGKWDTTDTSRFPQRFSRDEVKASLDAMVRIGMARRALRFDPKRGGALNLTQYKLAFDLDQETGNPVRVKPYPIFETNQLVEEFMLLCNFLVAQRLLRADVTRAFIRHHPPPDLNALDKIFNLLNVDPKQIAKNGEVSAAVLQQYLTELQQSSKDKDDTILLVAREMLKKPMKLAKYAVSGDLPAAESLRHWALNIRYYTHFTSPIRRYADLIVHRQLHSILTTGEISGGATMAWYQSIAERCNEKKEEAKTASEESDELYLNLFIQREFDLKHPFHARAVVVELGERSMQLLLPQYGISKRVHVENELNWKVLHVQGGNRNGNTGAGATGGEEEVLGEVERLQVQNRRGQVLELKFLTTLHVALLPMSKGRLGYKMVAFDELDLQPSALPAVVAPAPLVGRKKM